jgi:hypothetical protein
MVNDLGLQIDDAFPPVGVSAPMQGCTTWATEQSAIFGERGDPRVPQEYFSVASLPYDYEILPD